LFTTAPRKRVLRLHLPTTIVRQLQQLILPTPLERPAARSGENLGHFSSLVGVVVIARKLTYGNLVAIPAIAETKNTRRYGEDLWLGTWIRTMINGVRVRLFYR
jgi:hypothetical protein